MRRVSFGRSWVLVLACAALPGCLVPEGRYDNAVRTMREEQAAHRKTAESLHAIQQKLALAERSLADQNNALQSGEYRLAEAKLDFDVLTQEHQDSGRMVDQLRGELARVGDHLRSFSEQKGTLETALDEARHRASSLERLEEDFGIKALLVRDLTKGLGEDIERDTAAVDVRAADIRVRLDAGALFDGNMLVADGAMTAHRVAVAAASEPRLRVSLTEHPASPDYKPEDVVVRMQALADVLAEAGVAHERIMVTLPSEPSRGEAATSAPPAAPSSEAATAGTSETIPPGSEAAAVAPPAEPPAPQAKPKGPVSPTAWLDGPGSVEVVFRLEPRE